MTKEALLSLHVVMHQGKGRQTGPLLSQYPSLWAFQHGPWSFLVLQLRIWHFQCTKKRPSTSTEELMMLGQPCSQERGFGKRQPSVQISVALCGFGYVLNFFLNFLSSSVRVRS